MYMVRQYFLLEKVIDICHVVDWKHLLALASREDADMVSHVLDHLPLLDVTI